MPAPTRAVFLRLAGIGAALACAREAAALTRRRAAQGVLTLAFTGFPPPLEALKASLTLLHGAALPAENPGSRWPKSSLGCLANGRRLTPEELARLHAVCTTHSAALRAAAPAVVEKLRLTLFACRSLERVVATQTLPLICDGRSVVTALPSDAAAAATAATLAEFAPEKLATYWVDVARDGGREEHYRGDARGATLVAQLSTTYATQLAAFRAAVDAALPGAYVWFADESLHITVRALI